MPNIFYQLDTAGYFTFVNDAIDILGYTPAELVGTDSRLLTPPGDLPTREAERARLLTGELKSSTSERQLLKRDGTLLWVERNLSLVRDASGRPLYFISVIVDISERKEAQEQIRNLAYYDSLTQLPNRRLLHDRCEQAMRTCARHKSHGAVLFLDLDRFKELNDTRGHETGDMLLIEVARRLLACVRAEDTVTRLGGDEFIVVLQDLSPDASVAFEQSTAVAEKIRSALSLPYVLNGQTCNSSASIGVELFNGADRSVDELLAKADKAMYDAKAAGGNAAQSSGFQPLGS
jgi:diguanylate cyclase (GGDEF)-like protein/PAS domain S-box-containing protein